MEFPILFIIIAVIVSHVLASNETNVEQSTPSNNSALAKKVFLNFFLLN